MAGARRQFQSAGNSRCRHPERSLGRTNVSSHIFITASLADVKLFRALDFPETRTYLPMRMATSCLFSPSCILVLSHSQTQAQTPQLSSAHQYGLSHYQHSLSISLAVMPWSWTWTWTTRPHTSMQPGRRTGWNPSHHMSLSQTSPISALSQSASMATLPHGCGTIP